MKIIGEADKTKAVSSSNEDRPSNLTDVTEGISDDSIKRSESPPPGRSSQSINTSLSGFFKKTGLKAFNIADKALALRNWGRAFARPVLRAKKYVVSAQGMLVKQWRHGDELKPAEDYEELLETVKKTKTRAITFGVFVIAFFVGTFLMATSGYGFFMSLVVSTFILLLFFAELYVHLAAKNQLYNQARAQPSKRRCAND